MLAFKGISYVKIESRLNKHSLVLNLKILIVCPSNIWVESQVLKICLDKIWLISYFFISISGSILNISYILYN